MEIVEVISSKVVACVGENVTFGALTEPPNSAHLVTVTWSGGQNPATGSGSQWTTNWSTPGPKTVIATCGTSSAQKQVTIVAVEKVVKQGTASEGPLYIVCSGDYVDLQAVPSPPGASFPAGEPHWTLQKPSGSSASLSNSTGLTTTLIGTDKFGDYVVTAKCCDTDPGDSITVKWELGSVTGWQDYYNEYGDYPTLCVSTACDGTDGYMLDDCGNKLEMCCCQPDGSGGIGDCAFRYFYNGGQVSYCPWGLAYDNEFSYKDAPIVGSSNKRLFTAAKHVSVSEKYGAGCWGFYCSKIVIDNWLTSEGGTYWRRHPDYAVYEIDEGYECPGH